GGGVNKSESRLVDPVYEQAAMGDSVVGVGDKDKITRPEVTGLKRHRVVAVDVVHGDIYYSFTANSEHQIRISLPIRPDDQTGTVKLVRAVPGPGIGSAFDAERVLEGLGRDFRRQGCLPRWAEEAAAEQK